MAELSPQLIERLSQAIELLVDRIGPSAQKLKKGLDDAAEATKKYVASNNRLSSALKSLEKNTGKLNERKKAEERTSKVLKEESEKLYKQYRENQIGQKEVIEGFISMRNSVRENTKLSIEQKASILAQIDGNYQAHKAMSAIQGQFEKLGKGLNLIDSTLVGFVRAYQSGGDSIGIASGMAKHGLVLATSAAEKTGAGISKLGTIAAGSANPALAALGVAAAGVGIIIEGVAGATKELIEKAFPILEAETRKLIGSFQSASQAGAVFGDGIDGLLNASAAAGLGVDKFAKILNEQSSNIAMSGMGMQEGARMLGRIGESMRKSGVTQSLLQLGYSVEEVTALNAQTIAQMRAGGGGAVNEEEVARYTQQYAKDLKTLASLTGEDVKSKDKEAKVKANTLAFNQKLAEMEPGQRTAILDSLKGMTAIEQQAFRERMVNNGQLISQETQMYENMVSGAAEKGKATFDAAARGELTLGKVNDLNAQFAEQIGNSIRNAKEIGLAAEAGVEVVANLAKNMNESLQRSLMITPESLQKTTEEVNKAMTAAVGDTTQALAKVVLRTNELEAEMNRLVGQSGPLRIFADLLGEAAGGMAGLIREVTGQNAAARQAEARAAEQRQNANVGQAAREGRTLERSGFFSSLFGGQSGSMQAEQRRILEMDQSSLERMARDQGSTVDSILKAVGISGGIAEFNSLKEGMSTMPHMARGGIVNMPESGGLAMLHGREAVIPLPDSMSLDSKGEVSNIAKMMNESLQLAPSTESMIDQLKILNNSMDMLLAQTRAVADHTERTARGVA